MPVQKASRASIFPPVELVEKKYRVFSNTAAKWKIGDSGRGLKSNAILDDKRTHGIDPGLYNVVFEKSSARENQELAHIK